MRTQKAKKKSLPIDPLQRLVVIIDGSEELGVVGVRSRMHRLERLVYLLLAMQIVSILAKGGDVSILASVLTSILRGGP